MKRLLGMVGVCALLVAGGMPEARAQQDPVKIGFIGTFTGPGGILGKHMYDGFMLGLEHAGGKFGGVATEVIKVDDQLKPEIGVKVTKDLLERDKVDFVAGVIFTNVMLAIHKTVVDSETFFIGANSGPPAMAGERCSPYFFAASYQQDTVDESMGRYLSSKGVKKMIALAPNYAAGRDSVAAFKRTFQGQVEEIYTPLDALDYSVELAQIKASGVDSIYVFYPGGFGATFLNQFGQAGLRKSVNVYSKSTSDWTTIDSQGEAAIGSMEFVHWNADLPNAANKKFVDGFKAKYGYAPAAYAEQGYDAAQLIHAALTAVKGNVKDKEGIRKALREAKIDSPRGPFKFNRNHFPIHNQYLVEAVKGPDGKATIKTTDFAYRDVQDSHVGKCQMTW